MSGSLAHGSNAEPNLTPMLDMVFQLVTFFMLVINFKAASYDLNLELPIVGSAAPVDTKGMNDLMVLNIDQQGRLNVYGERRDNIDEYIRGEAEASLIRARMDNPNLKLGDDLPTIVVVRADKRTPFKLLNRVIKSCQERGYRNFSMKAMNKEAGA
jgi:biopolymer transport protein ExbD